MTRIHMNVKDQAAAKRIAAAHEKSKRNPQIEQTAEGYVVSWDSKPLKGDAE